MNAPTYKISGLERRKVKKELGELKRHVKYYYNKLGFIKNRIELLYDELIRRGYNEVKALTKKSDWIIEEI